MARPKVAKLADHLRLRLEVQDRLEDEHSPEQIAAGLRVDFPEEPDMWVSHETIYQSLYVQGRGALRRDLSARLRTGRALRKPHRKSGERRGRIPDMVNISERPAEVEDRMAVTVHRRADHWRPPSSTCSWPVCASTGHGVLVVGREVDVLQRFHGWSVKDTAVAAEPGAVAVAVPAGFGGVPPQPAAQMRAV